jgi:hypothetical protein
LSVPLAEKPAKCGDAAKRLSDDITLHAVAGSAGMWAAVSLADGSTDRTPYPSRSEAVRHQHSPEYMTFVLIPPSGMTVREADVVLGFWRQVHDAGFRAVDPRDDIPAMPLRPEEAREQVRLFGGK